MEYIFGQVDNVLWEAGTVYFYLLLIIATAILAEVGSFGTLSTIVGKFNVDKKFNYIEKYIDKIFIFLAVSIPWFFMTFSNVGIDTPVYKEIFNLSNQVNFNQQFGIEWGYAFLNTGVRIFTDNYYIFSGLVSFLTIYCVFAVISKYRSKINVGLATFMYMSLFYIQAYNLKRLYLAASLSLLGYELLKRKEWLKYTILVLLISTIHFSAICLFIPMILLMICKESKLKLLLAFCGLVMLIPVGFSIISNFERYAHYTFNTTVDIGLAQIVYHLPLMALLVYVERKCEDTDKDMLNLLWVLMVASFFIGILGYYVDIAGRMFVFYSYIYIVGLPYLLSCIKKTNKMYYIIYLMIIGYTLLRLYLYLNEYLFLDGVMPYSTIFN